MLWAWKSEDSCQEFSLLRRLFRSLVTTLEPRAQRGFTHSHVVHPAPLSSSSRLITLSETLCPLSCHSVFNSFPSSVTPICLLRMKWPIPDISDTLSPKCFCLWFLIHCIWFQGYHLRSMHEHSFFGGQPIFHWVDLCPTSCLVVDGSLSSYHAFVW